MFELDTFKREAKTAKNHQYLGIGDNEVDVKETAQIQQLYRDLAAGALHKLFKDMCIDSCHVVLNYVQKDSVLPA